MSVGLVCALQLQGCTLGGIAIGAGVDALRADRFEGNRYEEAELHEGQRIAIASRRRERVVGDYRD